MNEENELLVLATENGAGDTIVVGSHDPFFAELCQVSGSDAIVTPMTASEMEYFKTSVTSRFVFQDYVGFFEKKRSEAVA